MSKPGFFCVIEGIDGSGKSTLTQNILDYFSKGVEGLQAPVHILELREPTSGPTGKKIREHLSKGIQLEPAKWLSMFIEDRKENVQRYILPALNSGRLIIQDRYYYSTAAYQGGLPGGFDPEQIIDRNKEEGFPEPDLVIYLNISPANAMNRLKKNRSSLDVFETLQDLERIHGNYERILPDNTLILPAENSESELLQHAAEQIQHQFIIKSRKKNI